VLKPLPYNVIDKIWTDRPASPVGVVETFPDQVAGATSFEKRSRIAAQLVEEKIDSCVITLSDSICWLMNIRGNDIDFNPLVLSYAVLHKDASVDWFVNEQKVPSSVRAALGDDIRLHPFENFADFLKGIKGAVQYDDARSSMWVYQLLSGAEIVMGKDPCIMPKACKTAAEQLSLKQAHIRDGVAITRFLFWFEAQDLSAGQITELVIEEKLEEFRRANRTYRGQSFSTIAGWAEHGAIIHYRATPESNKVLTGNSFLLLDSGAQYEYGTTDITRTIVAGEVTPEMKDRYTRVLKGHIALARARFSPETDGAALDALARQYLVEVGLNFAHGTGHGVGCFMCVHEEASSISPRGKSPFKPGMLVSNEPGYYLEGGYGIRHENLILCQEDEATGEYYFETVTVAPFDLRGIDWDLITDEEKQWLDDYHRNVFDTLSPFLDELELQWLEATLFPKEKVEPTEEEIAFSYSAYD
jgi:Xaa-Pro aminopeptidase